jgi:hypothetical protein
MSAYDTAHEVVTVSCGRMFTRLNAGDDLYANSLQTFHQTM